MRTLNHKAGTFMPANNPSFNSKKMFLHLLCLAALLLGIISSAHRVHAQMRTIDVNEFANGTEYLGMSGDTLKFQLTLGSEERNADNVAGYDVRIRFPKLKPIPCTTLVTVDGTWIAVGAYNPMPQWASSAQNKSLALSFIRADEAGKSGHGTIAKIFLVRAGGFSSSEAAIYLDGGVIMVDNANFRFIQSPANPIGSVNPSAANETLVDQEPSTASGHKMAIVVYPNPTSDFVDVEVADPKGCMLSLRTMQSQLIQQQACAAHQRLDISNLPRGTYLLRIDSETQQAQQLIMRR